MNDLRTFFDQSPIRRVLVVDDAYDIVPLARDLALDGDELTFFFEDLTESDREILREIYPRYEASRADELQVSDEFIAALWNNRTKIRADLLDTLFQRYESDKAADQRFLTALVKNLDTLGLECGTAGRSFRAQASTADLIIIDLYLGPTQDEFAIKASMDGLAEVIADRQARPPLVVLMSRSSYLEDKRELFRDTVGLFESAFRIIRKTELIDSNKLQRILLRLVKHYADSLKLANFLRTWNEGLDRARGRTSRLIRTLDLTDYAQIHQLLLRAEGEPTGRYVVDVFDRVLQHEIESEGAIIDAAGDLNTLTCDTYPPPYVAGSPNLQSLVHRSIFQHGERLRLKGAEGSLVAFGDLLRRKVAPPSVDTTASRRALSLMDAFSLEDVLAVLTPACDLQHQLGGRVLLLAGSLRPLQASNWTYEEHPLRTPVIELSDGHWWIKWNLKHIETLAHSEMAELLGMENGFEIIARLREAHGLELQQKLLSNLGRVGLIAPMPATFRMRVEVYLPDATGSLTRVAVSALEQTGGVCFVGRAGQSDMRVVLCEDTCEAICAAIESYDRALVHPSASAAVDYALRTGELLQALEQGVSLPTPQASSFKNIYSPTGALSGSDSKAKPRIIGFVGRNLDVQSMRLKSGEAASAGVVLATWDDPEVSASEKIGPKNGLG